MSKILLIGHRGYLGTGLHSFFHHEHEVLGWDVEEDLFKLDGKRLARENVELLINLSVMADRGSPTYQVDTATDRVNVGGARHIAGVLKGTDITWIQMSTREVLGPVYGPDDVYQTLDGYRPKFLVNEERPYAPQNFYGKSKVVAEFMSESHPRSVVIRLTTCYTDFDRPGANWVVSLIRAAVEGKRVPLTQGGLQFRDPLHTDDLGRLMVSLHEHQVFGERIHAGGGERNLISLLEFVQRANSDVQVEAAAGGDYGFAFDIGKAARLTGWQPQIMVRDKIPIIADSIRNRITGPVSLQ